ncbi:MAG: hypothetical protein JO206_00610, partial [Solirubrobacterales bacterium]|nr:hypothetical protein [Solirubrobacterales bacterium]
MRIRVASAGAVVGVAVALAGCGSSAKPTSSAPAGSSASASQTTPVLPPAVDQLAAAEQPSLAQFPPANGRTLQQLGALVKASAQFGAATGTFTP